MRATAFLLLATPLAAQDVAVNPHVTISLVPEYSGVIPGRSFQVGVRFQLEAGWHVYWENPGESGIATTVEWHLPPGWRADPLAFPVPERLLVAGIVSHVHHGEPVFRSTMHPPAGVSGYQELAATVRYGICRDVCVPGRAEVRIELPVGAGTGPNPGWGDLLARRALLGPEPDGLRAEFTVRGDTADVALRPEQGCLRGPVTLFVREREVAPAAQVQQGTRGCDRSITVRLPVTSVPGAVLTGVAVVGDGARARAYQIRAVRR